MGYTCGRKWTKELLAVEALKYKSRSEFQYCDIGAYVSARTRGILDEICRHMIPITFSVPQRICQQIFDTLLNCKCDYNTRKIVRPFELDLYYNNYNLAIEYMGKGWHSDKDSIRRDAAKAKICEEKNIKLIIIKERNRNYESDIKEQIIENLDLINIVTGLNLTSTNVNNIIIDYTKIYDVELKLDDIKMAISNCKNIAEFQIKYSQYYEALQRSQLLNMLDKIREHVIRTNKELVQICKKITYYKDLINNHGKIYSMCHKRGILKEATKHMIKNKTEPYTKEQIIIIAKQFNSRGAFRNGAVGAYRKANKLGIINEIFPKSNARERSLTVEKVKIIRQMLKEKHSISSIARYFSVNNNSISSIRDGKTWKHII